MMKRILAAVLSFSILLPLMSTNVQAIDDIEGDSPIEKYNDALVEPSAIPDDVLWIINEDGVAETQEVFYLPEDGSLPSYITDIEYQDIPSSEYGEEEIPEEGFIYGTPEEVSVNIPIMMTLRPDNIIFTNEIMLTDSQGAVTTHIQIYDPVSDIAIFESDFPVYDAEQITFSEGQEYWISLVSDFGAYFDSYYGTIVVFGGSLEITGGWHFTTDKANLVGTENDIEPYGVTLNEREPNDSQYTANIYTNDADMYGTISRASDIDYYKVTFGRDGKANFSLEIFRKTVITT